MDDLYGNAWSSSNATHEEEDLSDVRLPSPKPLTTTSHDSPWPPKQSVDVVESAGIGSDGWKVSEDHAWTGATAKSPVWSSSKGSKAAVVPDSDVWGPAAGFQESSVDSEHLENITQHDESVAPENPQDEELPPPATPNTSGETEEFRSPRLPTPVLDVHVQDTHISEALASSTIDALDDDFQWHSPSPVYENTAEDVWESAWSHSAAPPEPGSPQKDEWEIAKEQAAKLERHVPPEIMVAIMEHLNALSEELWPTKESAEKSTEDLGNWRDGMSNVEGLSELVSSALPEVVLQPLPPFQKSNTARAVSNGVRLSRNLPIVRNSPLSHLFASKAASAWELSVKNRVEVQQDDIPAGWRMVESETAKEVKPVLTEKKSGILSFWSRRAASASTSSVADAKIVQPPERVGSPSSIRTSVSSGPIRRSSTESKRNSPSGRATPEPSASTPTFSPPLGALNSPTQSAASTETSNSKSDNPANAEPVAPSAVSRFWNRFSRTKSDVRSSSSSPRNSIALSTNELDFLSEIVPSAHDEDDYEDDLLGSLSAAKRISTDIDIPPPPALAPPPLAPPPRLSAGSTSQSVSGVASSSPKPASTVLSPMDDLSNLFGSAPVTNNVTLPTNPVYAPSPLLPPPLMPLSKPPSPAPFSSIKPSHSRTSSKSSNSPVTSSPLRTSSPANIVRSSASVSSPIAVSSARAGSSSVRATTPGTKGLSISPVKPLPMPPSTASFSTFDDDEFSAFHSPSEPTPGPSTTSFHKQESSFSSLSDSSFLSHGNESYQDEGNSFGDFSDFITSPIQPTRSPAFPPPPSTLPALPRSPSPPKPPRKSSKTSLHIRKPSAEERRAVENLVEKAAARIGRWPALPSPVPELLPKPPGHQGASSSPMASQQADFFSLSPGMPASPGLLMPVAQPMGTAPPASVFGTMQASLLSSPPALQPPPASRVSSEFGASRPSSVIAQKPVQSATAASQGVVGKSGLSAQDLSFFEGL